MRVIRQGSTVRHQIGSDSVSEEGVACLCRHGELFPAVVLLGIVEVLGDIGSRSVVGSAVEIQSQSVVFDRFPLGCKGDVRCKRIGSGEFPFLASVVPSLEDIAITCCLLIGGKGIGSI